MKNKGLMIGFILVFLIIIGCVNVDYKQKIKESGGATLTFSADYSGFVDIIAEQSEKGVSETKEEMQKKLEDNCQWIKDYVYEVNCNVNGVKITIETEIKDKENDEYYTFEKEAGVSSTVYTVEIKKIFDMAQYLSTEYGGTQGKDLDLSIKPTAEEKDQYATYSEYMQVTYSIEMPGEIQSVESGKVEGKIEGNSVSFNIFELMAEPSQIVIVAEKKNMDFGWMIIGVLVLIVILFLWKIFAFKKKVE